MPLELSGPELRTFRVTLYERERESSGIVVSQRRPDSVTFAVTNGLDPKVFNVPLTVLVPLTAPVTRAWAVREDTGAPVEATVRDRQLLVTTTPTGEPIRAQWK